VFAEAYERGDLFTNPAAITFLGKSSHGFKDNLDTRPVTSLVLAMGLGIRQAELRALRWENVDLTAGTVSIVESTLSQATQAPTGPPKWGKLRPNLPLPPFVKDELQRHYNAMRAKAPELVAPETQVICNADARMISPTWHSVRHSANTHALIAGAPPLAVAEYLGWTSPAGAALAAMQSHYAHLQLLDMGPVAAALEGVIVGSGGDSEP
jgi:integrase